MDISLNAGNAIVCDYYHLLFEFTGKKIKIFLFQLQQKHQA